MRPIAVLLLLSFAAAPARAGLDDAWRALPAALPADSLPRVLAGWEQTGAHGVSPGQAGYALGQFHYARGEFAPAAAAFQRAAARLQATDRAEARYGWALASFALGRATEARGAFDEVARTTAASRALAMLGSAQCSEAEGRPEVAFATLQRLLAGAAGEAAPPALERLAALADRLHRGRDADEARRRLVLLYPRSMEAARALGAHASPAHRPGPGVRLEAGATPGRTRLP